MSLIDKVAFFRRREMRGMTRGTRPKVDKGTRVLVIGGGISGVTAACVLAERGAEVELLEPTEHLGGYGGSWTENHPDGRPYEMQFGMQPIFRHYYNYRNLIRRVDPGLERLVRLAEKTVIDGESEGQLACFCDLPKSPPMNLISLLRSSGFLSLKELRSIDHSMAASLLRYDSRKTYGDHDQTTARDYLDSLGLPQHSRRVFFDIICRCFFSEEATLSAAEMLMMFHYNFWANPEGLEFDVFSEPSSDAMWRPMERYLKSIGVKVTYSSTVDSISRHEDGGWAAECRPVGGHSDAPDSALRICDALVLALPVTELQELVTSSPDLQQDPEWLEAIDSLGISSPSAVWRLYLDRPPSRERSTYISIHSPDGLNRIIQFDRFEGESSRFSLRTGGAVVELQTYRLQGRSEESLKTMLWDLLIETCPELAEAEIIDQRWLVDGGRPAFAPNSYRMRPRVSSPYGNVVLAGDFVKLPFPSAMMERATSSGLLAANHLLDRWDVVGEPLYGISSAGLMSP